jgi:zinc protease
MTKSLGSTFSALALLCAAGTTPAGTFPYEVHRRTLDNGLKVLLIPMPSDGLVSYWTVVRTGSRDEVEPGVTGFAHFFEHMMFRGSEKYPGPVYDRIVASMGADANAFTSDDLTAYHLGITREDLPTVIEIESDRFQNLTYGEAEFKTEAGAVYGEYRKGLTSPFRVLFEAVVNRAFDVHTYKHTTIGFEADIKNMPQQFEYSKTFFRRFYRPDNVVILVTGDFDPVTTFERIEQAYRPWQPGWEAPRIPVEPEQTAQRRLTVPFDGQTLPTLSISFKGERLLPGDRTMVAATLIGDLAFGETSSLYRKLVLVEQRVQLLSAGFEFNRDPGLWSVVAQVKEPADVAAVEGEIWSAIVALQRQPVDPARLDGVRSHLKYAFLSRLSTPGAVASQLARYIALTGDITVVDELWATYAQVTPEDVQRAAQRYLTPERSTVALLHTNGQEIPQAQPAVPPVLLPQPRDPNVAFKLWFKAGSQNDPPGKEGLAALTADLIGDGGTRSRSYEQILEALYPLAASYGASVDKEMTVLSGGAHREAASAFLPLLLDAVLNPGFREEDFERLKSRALDRLEKQLRYASDEELGKAALVQQVFAGTPYAHVETGTVAGLRAITLDDVRAFHAAHFTRDNVVIGLGGAYDDGLRAGLLAGLGRLPAGGSGSPPAVHPAPIEGRQVVLVQKPGQSTAISFGHAIDLQRGSKDFYALWVANSWLGEHRNSVSHLFQVLREARGMNYGDYAYIEAFPQGGFRSMPPTGVGRRRQMFEVWLRPVPDGQAIFALRAALREVERLIENGLTQEQFEAQRQFLRKYVSQFAKTTAERLGYAVDDRFYGIEEGHLARFRRMMDELTLADVNAAIRKYLRTDDLSIVMVTADAEALGRALVSGERSPIDYGGIDKPTEILEEDKVIEIYPLGIEAGDVTIVPVERMFAE